MKDRKIKYNEVKTFVLVGLLVLAFSYLLNFVWESFHAVFLYEGHDISSLVYVLMVNYVSIVDALLVFGIYIFVSLLYGNFLWIRELNKGNVLVFVLVGLITAATIEYRAIFIFNKWSYNVLMPTIFGLGISPLFQLSITGLISILIARNLIKLKGVYK